MRRKFLQEKYKPEKLRDNTRKVQDKHRVLKRAFNSIISALLESVNVETALNCRFRQSNKAHVTGLHKNIMNVVTAAPNQASTSNKHTAKGCALIVLIERIEVSVEKNVVAIARGAPDMKQKDKLTKSTVLNTGTLLHWLFP